MRRFIPLSFLVLPVSLSLLACGASDEAPAAGADSGTGGASPSGTGGHAGKGTGGARPSTGGATATGGRASAGGATGNGGTPPGGGGAAGAAGASTGGNAGSGGASTDAGRDSSATDSSADASREGGTVCAPDGGDGGRTWRDFSAGTCRSCPAALPTCDDFMAAPATFNPATRVLVFHLTPGLTELRRVRFTGYYLGVTLDAGNGLDQNAVIDRDTVTVDLSSQLPNGFTQVDNGILEFTDACGQSNSIGGDSMVVQIIVNVLDGGAKSYSVSCYANV